MCREAWGFESPSEHQKHESKSLIFGKMLATSEASLVDENAVSGLLFASLSVVTSVLALLVNDGAT